MSAFNHLNPEDSDLCEQCGNPVPKGTHKTFCMTLCDDCEQSVYEQINYPDSHPDGCSCGSYDCPQWQEEHLN